MKVLINSFDLNDYTLAFHLQSQTLEPPQACFAYYKQYMHLKVRRAEWILFELSD